MTPAPSTAPIKDERSGDWLGVEFIAGLVVWDYQPENGQAIAFRDAEPADPPFGRAFLWQSSGEPGQLGSEGDIMMKITDNQGTTKTVTLVDFSAV